MKTIIDFFKNSTVQVALTAGICIIIQSYFYKRILHEELKGILVALPGFLFAIQGSLAVVELKAKKGEKVSPFLLKIVNPIYWHLAIILTTALSILIPYYRQ